MMNPKMFLDLELRRLPFGYSMNQMMYIKKLARRFGIDESSKLVSTPMENRLRIERTGIVSEYPELRALIGGLLFIARNSRPDVLFAVNYVSRFMNEGTPQIFHYALRILKYLFSTADYSIVFRAASESSVVAYVDASFADARDSACQSTGGYLIFVNGDLVSWNTRKQKRTATSTTEAEYIALNDAVHEVAFIRKLQESICGRKEAAVIFKDNTSAMRIAEGTESSLSRFLLTKEFAIREAVNNGEIEMRKVSTVDQLADILTKALDKASFQRIRNFLLESNIN